MDYQKEIEKLDIKIKDRERQVKEIFLKFAEAYWKVWKFEKANVQKKPLLFDMVKRDADMSKYEKELFFLESEIEKFIRDRKVFQKFLSSVNNK